MLHYKTIEPATLGILKKIQKIDEFSNLRLVGGTALALQIGHRKSIDLDFFGVIESDNIEIILELKKIGKVRVLKASKNINIYTIDNIKVDIVNYPYQWLEKPNTEDNLFLSKIKDIAAITDRGTKKDFIDLYFLLQHFTLNEMLDFYIQKFPSSSVFLVIKSLLYFTDADKNEQPEMLKPINWNEVKSFLENTLKNYIKNE